MQAETERVRRLYDRVAPRYDRFIGLSERMLFTDDRAWAAGQAHGEVLEVAVGTGRNLAFYPAEVRLTGVDISEQMLHVARQHATTLGRVATLRQADAEALPFPDVSFDTVVCTLSLCTIPDEQRAVREIARVLRPGGRMVTVEHVASDRRWLRAGQRLFDPLFVRLQGDHLLRDPAASATSAGLTPVHRERFKLGFIERLIAAKAV